MVWPTITKLDHQDIELADHTHAENCDPWSAGVRIHVPWLVAAEVLVPSGRGDAIRSVLLHGLSLGCPLASGLTPGNQVGPIKIAQRGGKNHAIPAAVIATA